MLIACVANPKSLIQKERVQQNPSRRELLHSDTHLFRAIDHARNDLSTPSKL